MKDAVEARECGCRRCMSVRAQDDVEDKISYRHS